MNRRDTLLALLALGAAAGPPNARAQQPARMRRIGMLMPYAKEDPEAKREIEAFLQQLQDLGWTDGRNVRIDYRLGASDANRIRASAKELVELQPDVILARTTPVIAALVRETRTIPIVFVVIADPVGSGFAESLARPGRNVTGFTNVESSLGGKWLELLREVAPRVVRVSVIFNPETAPGGGSYYIRLIESAAPSIGVAPILGPVRDAAEIKGVLATLARQPGGGLIVMPDLFNVIHRELIISLAASYRIPAIYPYRYMTAAGGLMSYGVDLVDLYRRSSSYVDQILKGANPGNLPIQQPTKFELAINIKTAKALGLTIPQSVLFRADSVIE